MQVFAGDDQQSYYFNTITREISWEKPAGFVETKVDVQPKPTVTNAKVAQRGQKPTKKPKKYPFPELEVEKIELITSYDVASDQSSDEENANERPLGVRSWVMLTKLLK